MIRRPMKGELIEDLAKIRFPILASPKIDGFRCVLGEHPLTSRLSRFPNEYFHSELSGVLQQGTLLDGEVVVGSRSAKGVLGRTSSGLTSRQGEPDFTLWVFDRPGESHFMYRYASATNLVQALGHRRIRILRHRLIYELKDLERYIEEKLDLGFEGVMTRSPKGPYKEGKSTLREQYLLKIKPFDTFEARITGYYEEMENTNEAKRLVTGKINRSSAKAGKKAKGTLGGFIGKELKTGVEVRVGGGFTAKQRRDFWLRRDELVDTGAIMSCTKQKVGEKDKPRHPNFSHLRPEWDVTD